MNESYNMILYILIALVAKKEEWRFVPASQEEGNKFAINESYNIYIGYNY